MADHVSLMHHLSTSHALNDGIRVAGLTLLGIRLPFTPVPRHQGHLSEAAPEEKAYTEAYKQ
jgi:hypothetical protein